MERLTEKIGTHFQCNDRECMLNYCDRECDKYNRMINKLAEYEIAEEKGLLVRLPCKVGDTVYQLDRSNKKVITKKVQEINVYIRKTISIQITFETHGMCFHREFGTNVFLNKKEAQQALDEYLNR